MRRASAVFLVLTLLALVQPGYASAASGQDNGDPSLTVLIDSFSPVVPTAKTPIDLSGQVRNDTDQTRGPITISISISDTSISNRSTLDSTARGETTPYSRTIFGVSAEVAGPIEPGSNRPWSLRINPDELSGTSNGVYNLTVKATDFNSGESGSTSTFLPWFPSKENLKPTRVVWLWPISDWPNRDMGDTLLNSRTPTELSPDGRLRRLLDLGIAATKQVTWAVDPAATQTIELMSHGYSVLDADGQPQPGMVSSLAGDWITRARAGLASADVYALPYATPDVTSMTRSHLDGDVVLATTTAADQLGETLQMPVANSLAWPPGARTDAATLDLLQTAGTKTVVLDSAALLPESESSITGDGSAIIRTETGPMTAILTDQALSSSLGTPGDSAAATITARQRFLAELGVITSESPSTPRTIAIGPDVRWDPNSAVVSGALEALATSHWARSAPISALLRAPSETTSDLAVPTGAQRRAGLSPTYLERVKVESEQLKLLSEVLADPNAITAQFRAALLRTQSGAWRTDRAEGEQLLGVISDQLSAKIAQVSVVTTGNINLAGGDADVPITISNTMEVPVQVGLKLVADPTARLVSRPVTRITIPANRKISIRVPAQVLGSSELPVSVQLMTSSGRDFGQPGAITLRSSAYSTAATWVVGVAFVILLILLGLNSIRRHKQRQEERAKRVSEEDLNV